ncbi:MAG: metallophosphatase [Flavobacteriales bacterium]|nr:metallophosphatase [Flavobacteriales bacterium]|tara:strand:- start:1069 stop:1986 length:918 start_codon:yes stop_codon:yes gene_type:complete
MSNRRRFIKNIGLASTALFINPNILYSHLVNKNARLTIIYTNDMHSRIEPFDSGKFKGFGGMSQRSSIIKEIKKNVENLLILDAGDIFQGTPYYNIYKGEAEISMMNKIGYDAATIGNHEFDFGLKELSNQIKKSNFPFIISNYNFVNTVLNNLTVKYKIFNKSGIKIGVFGLGVELKGLVPKKLYEDTIYLDPLVTAAEYSFLLKNKYKCDFIICLSHLGYTYNSDKVSDIILAKNSTNIDLIIGGHTHTFLNEPKIVKNLIGDNVNIVQAGWGGIQIGRIDYFFNKNICSKKFKNSQILVKKS